MVKSYIRGMMMTDENGHKCWWDEELGIARGMAYGELTLDTAIGIQRDVDMIIKDHGEGNVWLIDLNNMKKATSQARKKISELSSDPRVGKYAFVGASMFVRTIFNFMMAAARKSNVKHFSNEEEALRWLNVSD